MKRMSDMVYVLEMYENSCCMLRKGLVEVGVSVS